MYIRLGVKCILNLLLLESLVTNIVIKMFSQILTATMITVLVRISIPCI